MDRRLKNCGCSYGPCDCPPVEPNIPVNCGCDDVVPLECTVYTKEELIPLNIKAGMTGSQIIKIINDYLKDFMEGFDPDPTLIESIGNGVAVYKGLSQSARHQIKSLVQGEGVSITETDDTIIISSSGALERDVISTVNEGNITAGQLLPKDMSFTEFVEAFLLKTFYPDLIPPSASLTIDQSDREIGAPYSFTGTLNFNRGEIRGALVNGVWQPVATQNPRSGVATNYNITGTNLGLVNSKTITGSTVLGSNTFSGYVDYADSNIQPTDSTGQPYDSPLMAGQVSASNSFEGKYRIFYGPGASNLSDYRSLPFSRLINSGLTFQDFATGTTQQTFYLAIPSNRTLPASGGVIDLATNQDITNSFVLQSTNTVPDAGGTPRSYKIYRMINTGVPYSFSHTFKVTLT